MCFLPELLAKLVLTQRTANRTIVLFLLSCVPIFSAANSATPSDPTVVSGPWGTIEYYEVTLEPPTSALWNALFEERSVLNFKELSRDESLNLLSDLGFSPELVERFDTEGTWLDSDSGIEVEYGDPIVEAMTTANRTALSAWLRANNPEFLSKQIMNLEIHDDMSLHRRLKPATVALLQSVTFLRKKVVSVMDRPYLMRKLGDDEEEKEALIRTLFSTKTLVAHLVVDDDADLESLVQYWSAGGKNPNARVVLDGVKASPGVDRIDLLHLLPPFPKKYLGSFIKIDDTGPIQSPDCFWASIHFFKNQVSPRMLDRLYIDHYLDFDFEQIEEDATFGDIIMLFDQEKDKFVHGYVQIAGPLVFTKNGSSYARPIILKTYEDMMSVYEEGYVFKTEIYRRKPGT